MTAASTGQAVGAGAGALLGSFVPGIGTAIGTAAGGMLGGAVGGMLGRENKETSMQAKQRELVDDLLASLKGQGPYSNLFSSDEAAFNKSFRDPAMSMFKNQVAPQIREQYAATGQSRGTSLDDSLMRAGVDMDQMLNQYYAQYQQSAQNRQMGGINAILAQGPGAPTTPSMGQAAMQGLGGYMTSKSFGRDIGNVTGAYMGESTDKNIVGESTDESREGFKTKT